MRVELIAQTIFHPVTASMTAGYPPHETWTEDADELAEFAGRLCYKSWGRPNPKTATNQGYLDNIIKQGHFSVLEHGSATFYIDGVSRSLTHELVRHRHFSYSQVSQRYVDESQFEFIIPPDLQAFLDEQFYEDESGWDVPNPNLRQTFEILQSDMRFLYKTIVDYLMSKGLDRKAARGAARSILPNGTETAIVVTGNMRAWREFVQKRNHLAADREIRELADELLGHLKVIAPNCFQDMELSHEKLD